MSSPLTYTGRVLPLFGERRPYRATYLPTAKLVEDVNRAIISQRPLLIRGEPGCGKTSIASAVAHELGLPYYEWYIKSTSRARDGLYIYDAEMHLRDLKLAAVDDLKNKNINPNNYILLGPLGYAYQNNLRSVVLIDEIDKADIDFPDDLLKELDVLGFFVKETGLEIRASYPPIVFITSNDKKLLPETFTRHCISHLILFPSAEHLMAIVHTHYPDISFDLVTKTVHYFLELRNKIPQKYGEFCRILNVLTLLELFQFLMIYPEDESIYHIESELFKLVDNLGFPSTAFNLKMEEFHQIQNSQSILEPSSAIEVFYSYSHKDERLRDKLETHLSLLKQQGIITNWHDRKIDAGREWMNEINDRLNTAQIILLLISPDFIASDYCYSIEMKRALERHEHGEAHVIPVILRRVHWQESPFGKLQALPSNAKPAKSWHDIDDAFFDVAEGVRKVVKEIRNQV